MADRSLGLAVSAFSQEEQGLLETFDRELHKTVETLKVEKQKNLGFRKEKQRLEQQINQTNSKIAQMAMIHEKEKEKLKQEFQAQIKQLQSIAKKPHSKITQPKKKPSKQKIHLSPQSLQPKLNPSHPLPKSLSKGFKLMLLQQFIQFFAALLLTRIKFPHKFRSIKRILPMTFILLRLGVFILVTQFRRVCGYVMAAVKNEEGLGKRIERLVRFFGVAKGENDRKQGNRQELTKKGIKNAFGFF